MIPKQIVNNINYLKIFFDFFFNRKFKKYNELFNKLSSIFFVNNNYVFIGRARAGIFLAVKIFLKKKKSKVLMSPFTIPDVVNMVECAGGTPVFLDFEEKSTFFDINKLNKFLKTNEFSALILTHYNINDLNYKKIYDICKLNNVKLIEDCAISAGGTSHNLKIGSLSDATVYSFSAFKYLNFFYGGLIVFKDSADYQFVKNQTNKWIKLSLVQYFEPLINTIKFQIITSKLLYYFISKIFYQNFFKINNSKKKYIKFHYKKMNASYFSLPSDSFFFEIDRKISSFDQLQNHRRKISNIYFKFLKPISIPNTLTVKILDTSSCYNYLIYVKNRDFLRKKMANDGFDIGYTMYPNCHNDKNYQNIEGSSKNVDSLIENCLVLPTHQLITEKYAEKLSQALLSNYFKI
jgi:dTDP-4-amino-4,6-dideoxygalactose transaminase